MAMPTTALTALSGMAAVNMQYVQHADRSTCMLKFWALVAVGLSVLATAQQSLGTHQP